MSAEKTKGFGSDYDVLRDALQTARDAVAALVMQSHAASDEGLQRVISETTPGIGGYLAIDIVTMIFEVIDGEPTGRTQIQLGGEGLSLGTAYAIGAPDHGWWNGAEPWESSKPWTDWVNFFHAGAEAGGLPPSVIDRIQTQLTAAADWLDEHPDQMAAINATLAADIASAVTALRKLRHVWETTCRKWKERGGRK